MALFESRKADKATEEKSKRSRPARRVLDSVDDMRRRARHRLIGACLLVLTAIVIFPVLFDTEPRPLPVNAKVSVAGRDDTTPSLNVPTQVATNGHGLSDGEEVVNTGAAPAAAVASAAGAANKPVTTAPADSQPAAPKPLTAQTANAGREPVAAAKPAAEVTSLAAQRAQEARTQSQRAQAEAAKPAAPASTSPAATANTTNAAKPAETRPATPAAAVAAAVPPPPAARPPASAAANSGAEAARARALLEGRPVETTPTPTASRSDEGRFIVQIGAFSDEAKVREIKQKLESVGLKTYTQVVQTSAGRATRVRVGPFANRADADRAAERVKGANLPAAIMSM